MSPALNREVLEAAASWYVELRCAPSDPALLGAHSRWLAADPSHAAAWSRVGMLQSKLERITPGIGERTLNSAFARRRASLKVLGVLMLVGGSGVLGWRQPTLRALRADEQTAIGERRDLTLADGSQLQLNTGSAVNIRFDARLRSIELVRGEIAISTSPDPLARPLLVHTAEGSVRALGTRFVVRREGEGSQVSVQEHAVEVRPASLTGQVTRVEAGQCVSFDAQHCQAVQPASGDEDAWTQGMLVVHDWRLEAFLRELGRYRRGHLGCSADIAALRISGAFQLADSDLVLRNLCTTLSLQARHFTRYWVQLQPA
ncbi:MULTISPECIES: FecR domain-containing protein [unclassified Pseudomonas]|uniref:FecR domain-containing protein n=1 Tax=unclassified Pseudomonas TaxID=196821 RepID=UPI0021BAEFA3|nr:MULTISPECIES: FecR domain-containing protein [unclassified Pseudomonas]MCT8163086.1 FecR domain-containing protein [Pseudomonas sp. HD6422]MCT8181780.1 FecR domain-containing protein [Pseudomonas sp. HD6421]